MITNRRVKVFPNGNPETYCTDHWRCRFVNQQVQLKNDSPQYLTINYSDVIDLLVELQASDFDVIKTENLYEFDGQRGFSLGQGE